MARDLGITFAGGGNRCFYQLGLLRAWPRDLWDRVAGVASSSAGACVALTHLSGRAEETHAYWRAALRRFDQQLRLVEAAARGAPRAAV